MPLTAKPTPRGYRPFTREASARVAKQFKISDQAEALFKLVVGAIENYEKFLLMPDLSQQKEALVQLSKALGKAATVAVKHEKALEDTLHGSLLRGLGELLTYQGIERLLDCPVARPVIRKPFTSGDKYEKETELDRGASAAGAGPKLLIALLQDMKSNTDLMLGRARQNRGGRQPKDLLRDSLIYELAKHYNWFFGKPPTSSATGHFASFCRAVLGEMKHDMTGLDKAIENIFAREGRSVPRQ